jgi:hypothetical protein
VLIENLSNLQVGSQFKTGIQIEARCNAAEPVLLMISISKQHHFQFLQHCLVAVINAHVPGDWYHEKRHQD